MPTRLSRLIDRTQFLGLLLAIVLVPLVFNVDNQNIVLLKPVLAESIALVLFGLWIVEAVEKGDFRLVPTSLNIPVVAYFLWMIFTVLLNTDFIYFSLEELNRYLSVFLFYFLAQKTLRSHRRLKWCLWILFAVCLVATGYGYLQYFDMQLVEWGRDVLVSTFGNKNFFSGFLVLTMPVVVGYALATPKWPIRIILAFLGAAQFLAIMITETRTGFLAIAVGGVLMVGLGLRFVWWPRSRNRLVHTVGGFVGILLMAALVYGLVPDNLKRRLGNAVDFQQGTGRVRWIMWTGSSRAAMDEPLAGHAHGSFQQVFPAYRPTMYHRFRVSHNTRHSHNEFLEVFMETGTVGLTLFLLIFVVLGLVVYRFLNRNRSWFYQWLVIGLTASVGASLAQNFASVNMRWMSSTFLFWLMVSLVTVSLRIASRAESAYDGLLREETGRSITSRDSILPPLSWKTGVHAFVALVLAGAGYGFYNVIMGDFKLKNTNAMIRLAEQRRISMSRAAEVGRESLAHNPYNLSARYKLGYIHLKQPDHRKAYEAYDRLTDLAPNYAQIHNNIALIHRNLGRPYHSLLHFEWATVLEDNFRNHLNLMRRHANEGLMNRSLLHGLSVARVYNEEQRDHAHRGTVKLGNRRFTWFDSKWDKHGIQTQAKPNFLQALSFLERNGESLSEPFAEYLRMKSYLIDATAQQTLRRILDSRENEEMIGPLSFLAVAAELRRSNDSQGKMLKREYLRRLTEWLNEKPGADPMYRLAVADLYDQLGRTEPARQALRGLGGRWSQSPYLTEIVDRVGGK